MTDFIISAFADEAADSLEGQIAALKRNGLTHIETRNIDKKCIIDAEYKRLKQIAEQFDESGIDVSAIASPIGKIRVDEPFEPHFERFKRAVEAACVLSSKYIRLFSFYLPENTPHSDYKNEIAERLNRMCEYSNGYGVSCCHENEKDIYGDLAERVLILKQSCPKLKFIFDPANYIQSSQSISEAAKALLPSTEYMHIKDALYKNGSVVKPGSGDGGIPNLISEFHKNGPERILSCEPHLFEFTGLSELQSEPLKNIETYDTPNDAFDAAVNALKQILSNGGYSYE